MAGLGLIGWILSAVVALAAAATTPPALKDRTLVVGSEQDFPPFAIGMSDAEADGFTVELWRAVARVQGLDYTIRVRPFDDILRNFKAGTVDVLLNLAQSDERRRFADFSVRHVEVGGAVFVRRGEHGIRAEADLAGKSLIVIKADLAHDFAVGRGWQRDLVLVDTAEAGLRLLASGRHDAMLLSKLAGLQTLRSRGLDGLVALDVPLGFSQRFAFAVRKGDAELLASINEGLAVVKARGEYDRLFEKWFGVYQDRPEAWHDYEWLLALALVLAAAAGLDSMRRSRARDRQAAQQLRASEERWKFALEGAGDGVWDADLRTGATLYSRRWKEILGHQEHEIGSAADEWSRRIHPEDLARVMQENQDCLDGRSDNFVCEFRMRAKDGHWVWVLDRGKVVERSPDGKARRMIGTHTDISERKAAEARTAAHAGVMMLLATGSSLEQILTALVGTVETRSDWRCSVFLLDARSGAPPTVIGPQLPDTLISALRQPPLGLGPGACGVAVASGLRFVCADVRGGTLSTGWAELMEQAGLKACWAEPIVGADGAVLGAFSAYHARPITPAPAEVDNLVESAQIASIAIERKRGEQALRDSEERLQRALDASRLALWDFDFASGEVYLSDAWSEMLGGPRVPTRSSFDALSALVPEEDQPQVAQAMGSTLRGLTPNYAVEHRVRRPDGDLIWVLSQGRVVERDAQGRVRRAVGTNRDITDRKRAESVRGLLEAQLREAQKLEAIGTLAGGIAHDFNNIMAAILGNVEFARQDIGVDHAARTYLEQINKAGLRARSLVQQILAFSRKQANELVIQPLAPMVEETLTLLRPLARPTTTLRVVLPDHPVHVLANITQLQQVLLNLGTNACQSLAGGSGLVEIGLRDTTLGADGAALPAGLAPGRYAQLWVRDDGCGMDDETRLHIFEPFFTTKPVGQGTGLGLAVAHGIVETHRGAIAVTTAPGQGSTFDVYLPLAAGTASTPQPPTSPTLSARGQGQHVLYVDDDEVMALMVQSLLGRLGYRATCLLDAQEAIALVEAEPAAVDLVVTDFNMPNVSGLDLVRALSRIRPDLPVAISSGYVSDELRASAAALGVHAIMQKERTLEELGALVHEALAARGTSGWQPSLWS